MSLKTKSHSVRKIRLNSIIKNNLVRKKHISPLINDLKTYTKSFFKADLIAGLTIGVMLVPQGMAYAYLAGLPPIYGLYGGLIPLIIFAFLGTSRQLSIGPVAVSALLILAGVSNLAEIGSDEYIALVILAGFLIGLFQVILGLFRLGFLVNFISHPVIAGFTSAAAIIIIVSQLKDILGIAIPRSEHAYETIAYAFTNINQIHWLTLIFCLGSLLLMIFLRWLNKSIPYALIAVLIGTLTCYFFKLEQEGLAIVGEVPSGLPLLEMPAFSMAKISMLMPVVLTVTLIGIVESIGIAKLMDGKHDYYNLRPNHELIALGMSKIGGSFFQALPTSGSFTRSAIANETKARTHVSSLITALLIFLTLLFFTSWFYYLPKSVLAAIILLAVKSLFDIKEARSLWKIHKRDFTMMMATFICTLVFGIEIGVLIGVVLSILMVLYRSSHPHMTEIGNIPGTKNYRNIERFEVKNRATDRLILRFDEKLYFGNASFFKLKMEKFIDENQGEVKHLLLDAKCIHEVDSSGLHALESVIKMLKNKGISFYFCGAIGPTRDILKNSGVYDLIGHDNHFMSIHQAIEHLDK